MTTWQKRARKKANRRMSHPHPEHVPGVRCLVCQPLPKTWDRGLAGKAV